MRNSRILVVLGALLGLVLGLGALKGMLAAPASPTPKLRPTPSPGVLGNGWYRYTDLEAGYSISYPAGALLDAQNQGGLEFKQARIQFPTSVGPEIQEMIISVYSNSDRSSLPDIVQQKICQGQLPGNIKSVALIRVRIAGLDAAKLEMAPFFPAVMFSAGGRIYFVALPMNMVWGNPPTQASVDLFYQIINTFSLN